MRKTQSLLPHPRRGGQVAELHSEQLDTLHAMDATTARYFFEATTAMAFWYFNKLSVDVAVVEVGLGGRLDSTNVLNPSLSVITSIGIDHRHILGDSLENIAREKGGIIKNNIPQVTNPIFIMLNIFYFKF